MNTDDLINLWPMVYATILQFWRLLDVPIEEAALRSGVPVELYSYVELGLDDFSVAAFQKRDPYSNPDGFLTLFTTLAAQGWIEQVSEQHYRVTEQARSAACQIIRAGYNALGSLEVFPTSEGERLTALLKRLVDAAYQAQEPPEKWALLHRFRVATEASSLPAQVREYLMDLFAYRDDAHISAWMPYGVQGPAWNAFTSLWRGDATSPAQLAEQAAFRGYTATDYEEAIQELLRRGWVEEADRPGTYRVTRQGQALRDAVEQLTDGYFYAPWSSLSESEIVELRGLLTRLAESLQALPAAQEP